MTTIASAPGKLVVLGEYVVLEGAPALVAAVNRRARVELQNNASFLLNAPDLGIADASFVLDASGTPQFFDAAWNHAAKLDLVRQVLRAVWAMAQEQGAVLQPCRMHLDTSAFFLRPGGPKLGLGSSAALSTALLSAMVSRAGLQHGMLPARGDTQRRCVMDAVQAAHAASQKGAGSGVDVAASVWGGLVRYTRASSVAPFQASRLRRLQDVHLVAVWAGEPASTPEMLARVAAFKAAQPQAYWELYEKLAIYANAGAEFWALGNTAALFTVIDAFHEALRGLGEASGAPIITPAHAAIYALARAAGCFYKSSGAGGGDMGLAFCPSSASAERLRARLASQNFTVVPLHIDDAGVEVNS